jgi:MFS family permease
VLRGVSASGALALGGLGLLTVAFPFLAADELGADRSVAGYMWAAFASGSMIGALLLVRLQTRWRPERVMLAAIFGLGLVMLSWPLASSVPVALALIALGGLVDGPGLSAQFAARQRWTPSEMLGQIFTTAASMKVGAFAIGAAVAGPAVVALGAPGTIVLAGSLQIAAVGLGLLLGAAGEPATEQHTLGVGAALDDPATYRSGALPEPSRNPSGRLRPEPAANPAGGLPPDGLNLQQDDRVHEQRDAERDRPAVQVALDERAAPERARPGAADAERAREPGVLPRMQQHEEDEDHADEHLQDGKKRVHGRGL